MTGSSCRRAYRDTPENGPWFPIRLGQTWTVMRRDWKESERPPIAFLFSRREAEAVATTLNEVWQLEAGVADAETPRES